ncbi:hypothetical protein FQR65_LT08923 [Abscondita terminalis]|nr:hypothetical protein FQR65_LT08923 [Abscondita terminalis]
MNDDMNLLDVVTNPYFVIDVTKAVVKPTTYRQFQKNFVVHLKSGSLGPFFSYMEGSIFWDRLNVPNTKYVIITPQNFLDELFLRSWYMGITNLVVIHYSCDTKNCTTRVITANPQDYDNDCARKFVTSKIEICSSNTTITFPKILRKFTNCNVLLMDSPSELSGFLKRKTVYFSLITAADFLNASFKFTTNVHPYDLFFFKEVAFGLNSFLPRSSVVFRDDNVFVVPTPKKISPMEILKIVFKRNVWIAIVVTYILISTIWYVFLKYFTNEVCDLSSTLLSIWSITLFGSINQTPRSLPLKLIFIVYVVYSVHIQTAFVSNLVDILTVTKYEKGITSVEELAVSNIPIYVHNATLYHNYFLDQNDVSNIFNKIKQRIIFINNMWDLHKITFSNNFSAIHQRNKVEMMQVVLNKTFTKFVDNSLIGEYKSVLITGYGSYVLNSLNECFSMIEESGLLDNINQELLVHFLEYMEGDILWDSMNISSRKYVIIAQGKHIDEVFLRSWSIDIVNLVVIQYSQTTENGAVRIITANPQANENNCAKEFIASFPKILRKFIKCIYHTRSCIRFDPRIVMLGCAKLNSAIVQMELEIIPFKKCLDHIIANLFKENETLSIMNMKDDDNLIDIVTNPYFVVNLTKTIRKPGTYKFNNYNFVVHHTTNDIHNVFSRFSKKNCTGDVFTANPQDYENHCGNKFIKFKKYTCFSKNSITFPNILRKYTNCDVSLANSSLPVEVDFKRSILNNMFKEVIMFLNASMTYKSELNGRFFFLPSSIGSYPQLPKTCIVQRDDTVWVVPSPRKIPSMEVLKLIFDQYLWGAIFITIVLTSVAWFLMANYFTNDSSTFSYILMTVWSITLFGSASKIPACLSLKMIFIAYVVYAVHIQTAFNSDLVDILTVAQYEKAITNLDELSDSGIPILMPDIGWYRSLFSDNNITKTLYNKIKKKIVFVENVFEIAFGQNGGWSYVYTQEIVQMVPLALKTKLNSFVDNSLIGEYKRVLAVHPKSYLLNSFNKVFNMLLETGFEDKLINDFNNDYKKKLRKIFHEWNQHVVLTLHHVVIVFVLWICGILISVIVFTTECFVAHYA